MHARISRRALAALAVAALLVTAGCAGFIDGAPAGATNDSGAPNAQTYQQGSSVFVTASGQAKADPNKALVRVAVVTTGDTAQAARQKLAENTSRLRQALLDMGLSEDQITTMQYDLRRDRHRPREGETTETTYRGIHRLEITLTDLDQVGEVVDTAVNNGATRIDGVRFTLTQETRRQLKQQALTAAMGNAKNKATTVAGAADLKLQTVHSIKTGQREGHYREYMTTAVAASGGDGGTSFDAGPVTVTATVTVTYNASAASTTSS